MHIFVGGVSHHINKAFLICLKLYYMGLNPEERFTCLNSSLGMPKRHIIRFIYTGSQWGMPKRV